MKTLKLITTIVTLAMVQGVYADDAAVFKKKCGVCHSLKSVSNGKMGPDLTGYTAKRPEEYIKMYPKNPSEAKKKFPEIFEKEVKGKYSSVMPPVKLTEDEEKAILNALK